MRTHSYVNAVSKPTLACFYQTHFSGVNELEVKEKVVCYIYAYVEKKSRNGGITAIVHNNNHTLEATIKRRSAACHTNKMLSQYL